MHPTPRLRHLLGSLVFGLALGGLMLVVLHPGADPIGRMLSWFTGAPLSGAPAAGPGLYLACAAVGAVCGAGWFVAFPAAMRRRGVWTDASPE